MRLSRIALHAESKARLPGVEAKGGLEGLGQVSGRFCDRRAGLATF